MVFLQHILTPYDFSPCSVGALAHASMLARACDARLTLIHVYDDSLPAALGVDERGFHTMLERELAGLTIEGVHVEGRHVLRGRSVGHTIVEYARREGAGAIVMGTHGTADHQRPLLGSVATRVFNTAPVPVLTVPSRPTPLTADGFRRIVVGVDLSHASEDLLRQTRALGTLFSAQIFAVHVIDDQDRRSYQAIDSANIIPSAEASTRQRITGEFDRLLKLHDMRTQPRVVMGTTHQEITRAAVEHNADLIVIGASGHGLAGPGVVGSVTDRVVRTSGLPVWVAHRSI